MKTRAAFALVPTLLGKCSRLCPTSSAAVPDAALPPPSLESYSQAVVPQGEGLKTPLPREARWGSRVGPVDIHAVERARRGSRTPVGSRGDDRMDAGGRATQGAVAEGWSE